MSGTSRTVKRSSLALMFDSLIDCMANPDTSLPGRHPDEIAFNEKHYLGGPNAEHIASEIAQTAARAPLYSASTVAGKAERHEQGSSSTVQT